MLSENWKSRTAGQLKSNYGAMRFEDFGDNCEFLKAGAELREKQVREDAAWPHPIWQRRAQISAAAQLVK
jgi:hypothetical protein